MNDVTMGVKAPEFDMPVSDGRNFTLSDASGKKLILYFYPKDDTKGCTVEAIDFSALSESFAEANAIVIGISPDTLASHAKFEKKHDLSVLLGSDEDHAVAEAFGVWKEKACMARSSWASSDQPS
nr:peroxiredoxin [Marinicella sp. W31]MDC2876675.1 peroxiredoxin [Marinicella sp. W31]